MLDLYVTSILFNRTCITSQLLGFPPDTSACFHKNFVFTSFRFWIGEIWTILRYSTGSGEISLEITCSGKACVFTTGNEWMTRSMKATEEIPLPRLHKSPHPLSERGWNRNRDPKKGWRRVGKTFLWNDCELRTIGELVRDDNLITFSSSVLSVRQLCGFQDHRARRISRVLSSIWWQTPGHGDGCHPSARCEHGRMHPNNARSQRFCDVFGFQQAIHS